METNDSLTVILISGVAAMLLLFISLLLIFIFTQRKKLQFQRAMQDLQQNQQSQLLEAAVQSEETERLRIAEILHDDIGVVLSAAKLYFSSVDTHAWPQEEQKAHKKGNHLLDEAVQKIRGVSHNLHSAILQGFGLNAAIEHFMQQITGLQELTLHLKLDPEYVTSNSQQDILLYRILQELVQNIIKHAQASVIYLSSQFSGNQLEMFLQHDGRGLTQEEFEELRFQKEGLGLKNIQNRMGMLNGVLQFSYLKPLYHISIRLPKSS
ncbi:ATP-binding protein [Mucilaginibacter sp. 44-25]|uniref:sensor histidine kinase n=1 Tax=Mucilaginibacter sp. 44-25 TaxID=1895794 RepID=UPI000969BD21|nr:ATP-binding protein [Mucilaginibacter sp. 44-25]OJW13567.1 MAG: hypothetical protein BGO48_02110 [Mucilaginibacter sp. 44-25]